MKEHEKYGLFDALACLYCGDTVYVGAVEAHLIEKHGFPSQKPKAKRKRPIQEILPGCVGFRQKIGVE